MLEQFGLPVARPVLLLQHAGVIGDLARGGRDTGDVWRWVCQAGAERSRIGGVRQDGIGGCRVDRGVRERPIPGLSSTDRQTATQKRASGSGQRLVAIGRDALGRLLTEARSYTDRGILADVDGRGASGRGGCVGAA